MLCRALAGLVFAAALCAPAAAQTVDELIAKSLEARGGLEKLKAIRSIRMTGRMSIRPEGTSMGPGELPMTIEMKRPAFIRTEITREGQRLVQAYDGATAWGFLPTGGGRTEKLPGEAAKELADQADLDGPLVDYGTKGHRVELVGREELEGGEAYKLMVTRKGGGVELYFLDAKSYLLVRVQAKRTLRGMEIEGESAVSDYREAGGFLWPHSIRNTAKGRPGTQTLRFDKIEVNPDLDDARFRMPARP